MNSHQITRQLKRPAPEGITDESPKKRARFLPPPAPQLIAVRNRSAITLMQHGQGPFIFNGQLYELITRHTDLSKAPRVVSMGQRTPLGNEREYILLDLSSPRLSYYFSQFLNLTTQEADESDVSSEASTQDLEHSESENESTEQAQENSNTPQQTKSPTEILENLFHAIQRLNESSRHIDPATLGQTIMRFVNQIMHQPYSEEKVQHLKSADNTVALETLADHNLGCCRHKTLFASYLLGQALQFAWPNNQNSIHQIRFSFFNGTQPIGAHTAILLVDRARNKKTFLDPTRRTTDGNYLMFEISPEKPEILAEIQSFYQNAFEPIWNQINDEYPETSSHPEASDPLLAASRP